LDIEIKYLEFKMDSIKAEINDLIIDELFNFNKSLKDEINNMIIGKIDLIIDENGINEKIDYNKIKENYLLRILKLN
jgi:GTPase involved in cell partitioning and DNA repair